MLFPFFKISFVVQGSLFFTVASLASTVPYTSLYMLCDLCQFQTRGQKMTLSIGERRHRTSQGITLFVSTSLLLCNWNSWIAWDLDVINNIIAFPANCVTCVCCHIWLQEILPCQLNGRVLKSVDVFLNVYVRREMVGQPLNQSLPAYVIQSLLKLEHTLKYICSIWNHKLYRNWWNIEEITLAMNLWNTQLPQLVNACADTL